MRHSTFQHRYLDKILLCSLCALGYRSGNLTCLTKTITDNAITVTYHNYGREGESTSTLGNLRHAVDGNQTIFQFDVTIYFYSIHCHNRLKVKTSLTSSVSQLLYTTVIQVTITIKNHRLDTNSLGLLCHQLAHFLSLLLLWHLLHSERRSRS